jgi:carbonic anhydrase
LSLEQDAAKIAIKLQSAIDRAATRQRAQAHMAETRTAKANAHGAPSKVSQSHKAKDADAGTAHQAATQGHTEAHWSYTEPGTGPEAWAELKPEFSACASGQRQSPVHIQEAGTLQGPAEPLAFDYQPSRGSVVNNGHTIQVDLEGNNTLTVRGSTYKLLQFHFHHPAEEKVNYKGFSMVAHLVHKNAEGQLAVVAVLIDPGAANTLVNKVWTHMPLDVKDRVQVPAALFDMKELLPQDQRYYQFMGSLTTPPCTEGVLWMVLKQPMTVSRDQLKLFTQLFPMNARPTQALNGRVVREAL